VQVSENIREASDAVEKSTAGIALEKLWERRRTGGAIIVLAVTSVLLYQVDGYLSIDSQVFGGITLPVGLLPRDAADGHPHGVTTDGRRQVFCVRCRMTPP